MIVTVMMVSGLRVMWRRSVRSAGRCHRRSAWSSLFLTCWCRRCGRVGVWAGGSDDGEEDLLEVGCFSTYSTLAGGKSCLSSARVPLAMIRPSCKIAIRSASCSASSRWRSEQHRRALPGEFLDAIPHFDAKLRVEPVVGSSRKITGGFPIRLIAMSRRRRIPPEYVATLRLAASVSWNRASRSSATWPASFTRRSRAIRIRFSRP